MSCQLQLVIYISQLSSWAISNENYDDYSHALIDCCKHHIMRPWLALEGPCS